MTTSSTKAPKVLKIRCIALAAGALISWSATQAQQNAGKDDLQVLPVQGSVYLLTGARSNVVVQVGNDGVLVVDSGHASSAAKLLPAIRKLSDKPIHWIVNTHADAEHVGGNEALSQEGPQGSGGGTLTYAGGTRIVAHQSVLDRMGEAKPSDELHVAEAGMPNDTYIGAFKDFFFNGEPVFVYRMPAAHTDGDSIVLFRRSDVVATGDLFAPHRYPVIDVARGGSVQGLIDALNRILDITVPQRYQEGGTYVIPGHGRVCDEAEVVEYRDMVTIVRDRIKAMIAKGMTLAQVKAAKPTADYDPEYRNGPTADAFVEAVYKSLSGDRKQ